MVPLLFGSLQYYRDDSVDRLPRSGRKTTKENGYTSQFDVGVDVNVSLEWYGLASRVHSHGMQLVPDPEVTAAVKSGKIYVR